MSQLFVGRLPRGTRARDLEDIFYKYGKMTRCDVKQGVKMAYGFLEYEDRRDAEDAIHGEHGRDFMGANIVVEWARGPKYDYRKDRERKDDYRGRDRDYDRDCDRRRSRSRSRDQDRRHSRSRSRDRDYYSHRSKSQDRDRDRY